MHQNPLTKSRLRVGVLDLDIFGPSIPTLMGLQNSGEPELTSSMSPKFDFLIYIYMCDIYSGSDSTSN